MVFHKHYSLLEKKFLKIQKGETRFPQLLLHPLHFEIRFAFSIFSATSSQYRRRASIACSGFKKELLKNYFLDRFKVISKFFQNLAKRAHFSAICQSSSDLLRDATSFFAKIEWQSPSNSICRSK